MPRLFFYKRFFGAYMSKTAHLSLVEHGAYTVLLDTMYATSRPLPADLPALFRICRATTPEEQNAVESVAHQFFPVHSDGLRHNGRADAEMQARAEQTAINQRVGQRGGRPRKTESVTDIASKEKPNRLPIRSKNGGAIHNPSYSKSKNKTISAIALPDWIPSTAWQAYVEMRKAIRKPLTFHAAELAISRLEQMRAEGQDPKAVLEQSVFNSWQGLFPVKQQPTGGKKLVI